MIDYLIVGAGLFGSVFAREATKKGKKCLVIEKRQNVGGNCYTEDMNGILVHQYGAHIFHTSDKEVWDYVNAFTPFTPFVNSPLAMYEGKLYHLPFNMNTFYELFGVTTPEEAKAVIARQIVPNENPRNMEEQALALVGQTIYKTLIKGYTEKQWGRSAKELPASIIRRLPLRFTFDNNYFNDVYQGIPEGGYTALIERLLDGIEVRCGVNFPDRRGEYENLAEHIVYTGAIDEYYEYCFGALTYRSLRFETTRLEKEDFQGNAVVNYTERDVLYTRIIEHKHFERGNRAPFTIITKEYPAPWKIGKEAYYTVNDERNNTLYRKYAALAGEQQKVIFGGRLGQYQYFDMDKTVRNALDLSHRIL